MPRPAITFNHAMIYTADLARALRFYEDALGFEVVDSYAGVYARLKSPGGTTTIALHVLDEGQRMSAATEGLRLYFEVEELDALCEALQRDGVVLDQVPETMPWGWRHAYLRDPDGHQISLYRAGEARLGRTVMNGRTD
jgi:catechol 2,3-dioxygenase-like lactoylglutathione lyase family enzyme